MKKRVLLFLAAIIICCAGLVGNTVAWLYAKTSVTNTFVSGDISITLSETTGSYYQLIPGATIAKDPKLTVHKKSERCWVFIKIEGSADISDYISYEIASGWTMLEEGVYYREHAIYTIDVEYPILKDDVINVKDSVTEADEAYLKDNGIFPLLSFKAYAVQCLGFDTPHDAWQEAKKL